MTTATPITALDHEILRLLLICPFQRAADLAHLLDLHPNLVRQRLAMLANLDLIADMTPGCLGRNSGRYVYLTPRGIALLATEAQMATTPFAQRWKVDLPGLARLAVRLPALATLQTHLPEIMLATDRAVQDRFAPRTRILPWYWVRNYRYSFRRGASRVQVWTDALMVIQPRLTHPYGVGLPETLSLTYATWFLLDPGAGEADAFLGRLVALLRLREHRRVNEGLTAFPPVVIFTASAYRASIWRRAAQGAAKYVRTAPLAGMIQIAPPTSADCWPPGVFVSEGEGPSGTHEWSDLVTGERRLLHQLFHEPLPHEALPPAIIPEQLPAPAVAAGDPEEIAPPHTYTTDLLTRLHRCWQRKAQPADATTKLGRHVLALTRRQIQVMGILAAHPLIPLTELSVILDLSSLTCRIHYLRGLIEQGLVTHVAIACPKLNAGVPISEEQPHTDMLLGYHLTKIGLALLARLQHVPQKRLPSTSDTESCVAQAGSLGQHNIGIYRFFALLIAAAREQGELHRLLWWETGSACTRRFATGTTSNGTIIWSTIRPDAVAEYAWGNRHIRFWLEWDMGTMTTQQLLRKFINYSRYTQSRAMHQEGSRSLPILYVVTPDAAQEDRIARILALLIEHKQLAPKGNFTVRTTTFPLLAKQGPLARIWQLQLPRPHIVDSKLNAISALAIAMLDEVRPLPQLAL